jgi:2-polyprenyl-3-methyl-5-hydroxy-6-metoxy-1,4-benzoquinol methylase
LRRGTVSSPDVRALGRKWDRLARFNAMWAILTGPETLNGTWTDQVFFESGKNEIANALQQIAALGVSLRREAAFDFGCGIGRITQALSEHFETCHGVDVSSRMIRVARSHNRFPDVCTYHVNERLSGSRSPSA